MMSNADRIKHAGAGLFSLASMVACLYITYQSDRSIITKFIASVITSPLLGIIWLNMFFCFGRALGPTIQEAGDFLKLRLERPYRIVSNIIKLSLL